MQVKIIGITKERRSGISKKNNKPFSGFFVVFGYHRQDMNGYETRTMLYTDDMICKNDGYVPNVGDECEAVVTFGGFVENLCPILS